MSQLRSHTNRSTGHLPAILELLSELEQRDMDSRGRVEPADFTATGFQDPRGCAVNSSTGVDVGKVDDVYVDPNTREPRFVVLTMGSNSEKDRNRQVLVDFQDVEVEDDSHIRVRSGEPSI